MSTHTEPLTDEKMLSLMGENYARILYYNFDAGTWNRNKYLGYDLNMTAYDTAAMITMRTELAGACKRFDRDIAAAMVMTINARDYFNSSDTVTNPRPEFGTSVVGNLVTRDTRSGQILAPSSTWFKVGDYGNPQLTSLLAAYMFAQLYPTLRRRADIWAGPER